ncbi:MAG: alkaline phosphatase, partial [Hyphomicrobiaceae bacterium]
MVRVFCISVRIIALAIVTSVSAPAWALTQGNVIFFHPDGAGANHWSALRLLKAGPDGEIEWDRLPAVATYTGHMRDALVARSPGGATSHAYGVKVPANSFGMDGGELLTAASGKPMSIMKEALAKGRAVGVVQSGHIAEPGTAVFLASAPNRKEYDKIARQVIASQAQVIMAGGERFLLPKGVKGRHGLGERKDNLNLIEEAKERGYTIVYTAKELRALDISKVHKLLGVFAWSHTFHDKTEEQNQKAGRRHYLTTAPNIAEMTRIALTILSRASNGFFLVSEEEGTDNMANRNNAPGQLEALRRADAAIKVILDYVKMNPDTLMIMAADSEAGGLSVLGPRRKYIKSGAILPAHTPNGLPLDGQEGTGSRPFNPAPDKAGQTWPFGISWGTKKDTGGTVLVRGAGLNSELIKGKMDNTDIYRLIYLTLFG